MNVYQKINVIQKHVTSVNKDATITLGQNSYDVVTHDAVTALLHKPMAEVGIVTIPSMEECTVETFENTREWQGKQVTTKNYKAFVKIVVTFVNTDNPSDIFKCTTYSYAFDTSDKAIGKAYSMGVKNIYLKTFMLESRDAEEARPLENSQYRKK